jgi:hypothetical protein
MSSFISKLISPNKPVKAEEKRDEALPELEIPNEESNVSNNSVVEMNSDEYKEFQTYRKLKLEQAALYSTKVPTSSVSITIPTSSVSVANNDLAISLTAGKMDKPITNYAQPKAAVDDKVQLPEFEKFTGKSISTDAFIKWKRVVLDAIDGSARYRPLLQEAKEGWKKFQQANSKYAVEHIEMYYLDAHRQLWSLISA